MTGQRPFDDGHMESVALHGRDGSYFSDPIPRKAPNAGFSIEVAEAIGSPGVVARIQHRDRADEGWGELTRLSTTWEHEYVERFVNGLKGEVRWFVDTHGGLPLREGSPAVRWLPEAPDGAREEPEAASKTDHPPSSHEPTQAGDEQEDQDRSDSENDGDDPC